MFRLFLVVITILLQTNDVASADQRREYTLTVSYASNSSSTVLINNQFPGPLIEAELDDILVVHVKNNLLSNEELTIHFHGMLQKQTPHMDGAAYMTQMPISSGKTFTYVFRANPAGTYFYHSHSGLQAVTAFGPLLVHDKQKPWNLPEIPGGPLLFSDQWLTSDRLTQEVGLIGSPFKWEGEPTDLLINGQRNFVMTLRPNTKYLLRLIGATSLSTIVFGIYQHPMTVVEVDGTLIKPKPNVNSLELASGQRYAVIIETKKQSQGVFLMETAIRWRALPANSSCIGVLRYGSISQIPSDLSILPRPTLANETDLLKFSFNNPYETMFSLDKMPTKSSNREYFLLATQDLTSDGLGYRWKINNAVLDMLQLQSVTAPFLFDLYNGNQQDLFKNVTYVVEQNEIVDIVIQNTVALNGVCESHPFHMHGHKFWVHSYGSGMYQKLKPTASISFPVLRDTQTVYATQYAYFTSNRTANNHRLPCGWTKIRMIVDNPGLWMFHCHIGAHSYMDMYILLKEDIAHLTMESLAQH
ncbi:unnamed protein product [Adineta steineri]|uniref:Uncharacterized protein n=1 Tax=Adineta steineri TaxID=433720 RepID=A0A814NQF3_9BILA|nr:unnamed protein product [Adineta steineri]